MLNTNRHLPHFDALEGKVLLSAGMADPAKSVHRESVKRFVLNGSVTGLPNGSPGVNGYSETSFPVSGRVAAMGIVSGSFGLQDAFIPIGKLPDLSGASLTLENAKGSVQFTIGQSTNSHYRFTIVSGTERYGSAAGSGTMVISSTPFNLNLVIKLHSNALKTEGR